MSIIQQISNFLQDVLNTSQNIFLIDKAKYLNPFINELSNNFNKLNEDNIKLNKTINRLEKKVKSLKKEIKILKGEDINHTPIDSISPYYNPIEVGLTPILKNIKPTLNFKDIIKNNNVKPSTDKAIRKLINPKQLCPHCSSDKTYHYTHSKTQKMCKCCKKTFTSKIKVKSEKLCCPHCSRTLSLRANRSCFDVYVCKNNTCPYRLKHLSNKGIKHNRDKISYIYRKVNLNFNELLEHINNSNKTKVSFNFRKFNFDVVSKVLYFKVNLKLSNRATSIALKDLFNISISHSTIAYYCKYCSKIFSVFNSNYDFKPSNQLVADETYIKIKGKKHYVWIVYDLINKVIISYKISDKRDVSACIEAIAKAIKTYGENIPKTIIFNSDMFTAYPLALQTLSLYFNTTFIHKTVKGLKVVEGENPETRKSKQIIERLNRSFKESYRVTTGYATLEGAIDSFELWMFYFNFLRVEYDSFKSKKSLNFISNNFNVDKDFYMPNKWLYTIFYVKDNLVLQE